MESSSSLAGNCCIAYWMTPWKHHWDTVLEYLFDYLSFIKVGVYAAAKPARILYLEEVGTLPVKNLHCEMSAHEMTVRIYWCWWDIAQEVSQLLVSIPQQRPYSVVRDSQRLRNGLLRQLVRNMGESGSRVCTITQSKLHLPKPTQLALPSSSLLFLNMPLSIFFYRSFWKALCWCRTEKSLKSRKSLGTGNLFLS